MKKISFIPVLFLMLSSLFLLVSCDKDDNFHSISTIERDIHNKVNAYRISQDLNTFVEQFLVFEEARKISDKLANGTYTLSDPKIQTDVNEYTGLLNGDANGWISLASNIENADSIVNSMINTESTRIILEKKYTQSGVGVSQGDDGLFYVCHILINIPD